MKALTTALIIILSTSSLNALAEGSVHHSGQASKHTALAASEGLASTAKVASVVMVTPVIVAGSVSLVAGSAVVEAGDALSDGLMSSHSASHEHHHQQTLIITEHTITADPAPNQVIKRQ
ncbi:hypothetical protein Q4574_10045 [Aliiglaciecola sp. 3_MG-2023]|uniref:hypothetical protein n=1 Tax=Aliiglaciecola sp. 3_MG-2023 TaxID=3062644 RepID=UPI0026E27405|nr:hypothetical protein [Aliiglaciecola sp. 3_MG-2023]MDO6693626.1 hypothetical protein [Aliiglaciecola sp. 3_MG-2023]